MLLNDRLLKALRRQPLDRTPLWMMRQAGRYLPEYRQVRSQVKDFMQLCKTPELACEVTMQPIRRYELDAAIIFSDILTIPDAMGCAVHFVEGEGPRLQALQNLAAVQQLRTVEPEQDLGYVMEAIRLTKKELANRVPLIGFAGSPWTLATYMVEGKGSKDFTRVKKMLYADPYCLQQLLMQLTDSVSSYLLAQVQAGADVLMIFDSWGGILTPQYYQQYSLSYMQKIIQTVKQNPLARDIPIILFTKGGGFWLSAMADSGCEALGCDWTIDLGDARERTQNRVALQGNLDPAALFGDAASIRANVQKILQSYGAGPGHIFNLGHGISQFTPVESVYHLIAAVQELSPQIQHAH